MQNPLPKERETTQALLEERNQVAAEKELDAEENTTQLLQEERAWNEVAHQAMYELLVVSFFLHISQIMHVNIRSITN